MVKSANHICRADYYRIWWYAWVCVCAISCEMAWFFLVEVMFCILVLEYVRFQWLEGRGVYDLAVFKRVSKIALGYMVLSSFRWLLSVNSAWMWNRSIVFMWAPFLWYCYTCILFCMVTKERSFLLRCFAKLNVWVLEGLSVLIISYIKASVGLSNIWICCILCRWVCTLRIMKICRGRCVSCE
jgi:hypothetical protein